MHEISILPQYNLILIRYNEIWLKSTKVKIRMLNILMKNIKIMLNRAQIPFNKYQLSKDSSRIFYFFKNENLKDALELFKKVFGIHSFSPALRTSNNVKNISEKAIEVAEQVINEGDTFALRVKRSGNHEFSSKDIAVRIGQDIIDFFLESNIQLKVNLTNPDKIIFIEVRDDFSYIFTDIIESDWGGLPIESNKKIAVMDVGRLSDLLAGFLLMKRGAEIYPFFFDLSEEESIFDQWMSNWREVAVFVPNYKFSIIRIKFSNSLHEVMTLIEQNHVCALCRVLRLMIISRIISNIKEGFQHGIKGITDGLNLTNSSSCNDEIDLQTLSLNHLFSKYPIFTPTIGLDLPNLKNSCNKISKKLINIDYCPFNPQDQDFHIESITEIINSSSLENIISTCISKVERINII